MTINKNFGLNLTQARKQRGLSQNALARALRMDTSHLNRIERGLRNPPPRSKIIKIIEALAITPDEGDRLLLSAGYAAVSSNNGVHTLFGTALPSERNAISSNESSKEVPEEVKNFLNAIESPLVNLLSSPGMGKDERRAIRQVLDAIPTFLMGFARQLATAHNNLDKLDQEYEDAKLYPQFTFKTHQKSNPYLSIQSPKPVRRDDQSLNTTKDQEELPPTVVHVNGIVDRYWSRVSQPDYPLT